MDGLLDIARDAYTVGGWLLVIVTVYNIAAALDRLVPRRPHNPIAPETDDGTHDPRGPDL